MVHHVETNHTIRIHPDRCAERLLPASTFKIFNSLLALDLGVVADTSSAFPWDGVARWNPEWNQDQTFINAFRRSTVWVYQEIARHIGEEPYRTAMAREHYGNADPGGGIDTFWLTGDLRISADEQVTFLRRLQTGTTGFSDRSEALVRQMMRTDSTATYVLRAKTGWAVPDDRDLGWFVGWVTTKQGTYVFALNVETADQDFGMTEARRAITEQLLRDLDVLPG